MSVRVKKGDMYDTKTVEFQNPEGAESYMVMMTAFDGTGQQHFEQYGYTGRYVMFVVETGGGVYAGYDPYKLKGKVGSDALKDFLVMVRAGYQSKGDRGINWDHLDDGGVYQKGNL